MRARPGKRYGDMARGHRFARDFSDGSKLQQCDIARHGLLTLLQCFSPAISDAPLTGHLLDCALIFVAVLATGSLSMISSSKT
jgi:hypothetical protein